MASFSEALQGLSDGLSDEAGVVPGEYMDVDQMQAKHRDLIGGMLPKIARIQREMRGRRYREVHAALQEAHDLLAQFQDEPWPAKSVPEPPEWMRGKKKKGKRSAPPPPPPPSQLDSAVNMEPTEEDTATISTAGETDEDEASKTVPDGIMDLSVSDGIGAVAVMEDDPQTREPMHEAVRKVVEAFVLVLMHPGKTNKATEPTLDCLSLLLINRYISGRTGDADNKVLPSADDAHENGNPESKSSILHRLVEGITKCSESNVEAIQTGVVKVMLAVMTSPKCAVHEATMLMAIRATFHVYLITKSPDCKKLAKSALYDMLKSVFNRMEAFDVMVPKETDQVLSSQNAGDVKSTEKANGDTKPKTDFTKFVSQFHTDGYLLFRALCKLSSKALPGDEGSKMTSSVMSFVSSTLVDPLALNSKILSLELLLAVLEYSGPAFCTGDKFIYAVQNYLCVSLLKNCMSNNTQVAYFSLKIFLILVYKFKAHLKAEIEVFMSNIFLRVLESPNSSFEQKALVLQALRALSSDPVLLTQIFLHYDCDFDAVNLYKDIVQNLTKLSSKTTILPPSNMSKKEVEQDFELSLAGLEVLVTILKAFLKALDLPVGQDEEASESASARLLKSLQIDVGLAATPKENAVDKVQAPSEETISAKDFKSPRSLTSSGNAAAADKIVDAFETKRAQQQNFELGVVKFTLSLKGGLKYFIDNGFVELDAKKIALFFLENKDKLDKTQMGEALGREPDSSFVKEEGVDTEKGGPGFWFRILDHYVDAFEFGGMLFDDAIRLFQSGFRLPGEAQKIDRIMEKFAERYTRQNLDVFPSADTAFILAFSVIMLNTDLHNPNIKEEKKMTIESFLRNNRGIADGGDLPEDFLRGIFQRIKSNPFSLKEDDEARERVKEQEMLDTSLFFDTQSFFGSSVEERKREKFKKEREEMMSATELLFKKRHGKLKTERAVLSASAQLAESIAPGDVVRPMFDVTWGPLIGTLSQVLECSNDDRTIAVCLNGFVYAIRIAAHSGMSLSRDTFVNSLAKFTFLGSIKEMKRKNIESIRTLLSIAVIDGEYLNESWGPVLQCISQLARLRLFASGLDGDETFLSDGSEKNVPEKSDTEFADGSGYFRPQTKAETQRETEESNSRAVVAALNEVLIDKVFSSTVNLSARSIAHFIEQLVEVSAMEIAGNSKRGITGVGASTRSLGDGKDKRLTAVEEGPRIFSLQRLVEVADYNMDVRPRLAWAQVWEIMADHFAKIGCHQNSMVSIFAIDSLKQLSFKFLEKPELSEFNFQRIFLKPFLQIMENNRTREDIRELILRCVDNMIRTMSHNIRSGWKVFFSVLTTSASDPSERINTLGLAILQRLLDEHLHQLCRLTDSDVDKEDGKTELSPLEKRNRNANVEDFVGLCRASLSFVQTDYSTSPLPIGLSMRALCHTACYADLLADRRVLPPVSGVQTADPELPGYTYEGLSENEALEMVLWRTLLDGLATGIRSTLPSHSGGVGCLVQRGSVLAMRALLLRHGHLFSTTQWVAILNQTILPALQAAAESDGSAVVEITSESPSVSSVDFLADPQSLPPPNDDEGLRMFAEQASSEESSPARPLGQAELLVEASFTDMRHGGDGNLSRAFELARKDVQAAISEQPFPDSWIATTAPLAIGTLTDIASEVALDRGKEGREMLWPVILRQFQYWAIGRSAHERRDSDQTWQPCEALVRVACREFHRFPLRLLERLPQLPFEERSAWATDVLRSYSDTISRLVVIEEQLGDALVRSKLQAYGISSEDVTEIENGELVEVIMYTPYGKGRLVDKRSDAFKLDDGNYVTVLMNVIQLEFGATLYRPAPGSTKHHRAPNAEGEGEDEMPEATEPDFIPKSPKRITRESWWETMVPAMKVRCVGVYCLQQNLDNVVERILPFVSKGVVIDLIEALNHSRLMAGKASKDEDLSHAFQEAMISLWGDGVEEVEEALSNTGRLSLRRGSEMFFLTQESGATKNVIHILSQLYGCVEECQVVWGREKYSEPLLIEHVTNVLNKFLASEARDGHLIDPNVWRNASESGGKLAIYCTAFAAVVVSILNIMLEMTPEKFRRHKQSFFPVLCSLVCVQSDEIRNLVREVFEKKIAAMIDVSI